MRAIVYLKFKLNALTRRPQIKDWEKTSLKPYIDLMEKHGLGLMEDVRREKRKAGPFSLTLKEREGANNDPIQIPLGDAIFILPLLCFNVNLSVPIHDV